jgi:hypothetical protein
VEPAVSAFIRHPIVPATRARGRPFLARNGRGFQVNSGLAQGLAIDSIGFSARAQAGLAA